MPKRVNLDCRGLPNLLWVNRQRCVLRIPYSVQSLRHTHHAKINSSEGLSRSRSLGTTFANPLGPLRKLKGPYRKRPFLWRKCPFFSEIASQKIKDFMQKSICDMVHPTHENTMHRIQRLACQEARREAKIVKGYRNLCPCKKKHNRFQTPRLGREH